MSVKQSLGFRLIERRSRFLNLAPTTPTVTAGTPTSTGVTFTGSAFEDARSQTMSEIWDDDPPINWSGAATWTAYPNAQLGGIQGSRVVRFTNTNETYWRVRIPINPTKLYKLVCRMRQNSVGTGAPPATYLGFKGYLANGAVANQGGGTLYCLATDLRLAATSTYVEYVSWVGRGATQSYADSSTLATSNSGTPTAPQPFNVGTATITPLMFLNYPGGGTPVNALADVDYFQIWEFADANIGDTHAASQWQVTTAADTSFASPVISTGDDTVNKTSYAASGLTGSTNYIARARYKDSRGAYSAYSPAVSFATAAP